jgi:hypothetical protein
VRGRVHIDGNLIGDGAAGAGRHDPASRHGRALFPLTRCTVLLALPIQRRHHDEIERPIERGQPVRFLVGGLRPRNRDREDPPGL